jgi:osmotically-inducible protein OsmY
MSNDKDIQIRQDVERELFYTPGVNAAGVGVTVQNGIVTLTGSVDTYAQKLAVLHAAERVSPVRAVACEMRVKVPLPEERTDQGLAYAAANLLACDAMPADRIRIAVENGWVTLEGSVDEEHQRDSAAAAVARLAGVKGVENLLIVNPAADARDAKEQIEAALKRSAVIQGRNILVDVTGDRVVLHGQVRSLEVRDEAERIAWSAPGISDVANHIQVAEPAGAKR